MDNSIGNGGYTDTAAPYAAHLHEGDDDDQKPEAAMPDIDASIGNGGYADTAAPYAAHSHEGDQKPLAAMPDIEAQIIANQLLDSKLSAALAGGTAHHDDAAKIDQPLPDFDGDDNQNSEVGLTMPNFVISNERRKNASGALICMAVGCEKNAQAKTKINESGGFCRIHFNAWLISTNQVDSWECKCGNKVSVESDRCGNCHRWKERRSYSKAITGPARVKNAAKEGMVAITHVPENAGVDIADVRLTNAKGRSLCKVRGCGKLDQAKNDGFCRFHFNLFSIAPAASNSDADVQHADWICVCGELMPGKQKRCGKCNKWRGGKREAYITSIKKTGASNDKPTSDIDGHWTCECGANVANNKARCGKCHHWRGGKRKGGWKIRPTNTSGNDGGIKWSQDWSCCDVLMAARKRRCGKCHKWRGGKRFSTGSTAGSKAAADVKEEYTITEFI